MTQPSPPRVPVVCRSCTWRGRRVPHWKLELNDKRRGHASSSWTHQLNLYRSRICPRCLEPSLAYPQLTYVRVDTPNTWPMPAGYSVLTAAVNRFVGMAPNGTSSRHFQSLRQAYGWVVQHALVESGSFPKVCAQYESAGRHVVVCGNCVSQVGTIWVMDMETGARTDPLALTLKPALNQTTEPDLLEKFTGWAREGNAHATWWLAWWFEGVNHPKSVWYYVAAMRIDPAAHGWVQSRLMSDARSAHMCEGVPKPDLRFLNEIPELQGCSIRPDWHEALREAESAIHIPAISSKAKPRMFFQAKSGLRHRRVK